MDAGDACFAVEIGKRAGDTKGAVIAPRAQAKCIGGLAEKCAFGVVWSGDVLEQAAVAIGIGARARMLEACEALGLNLARRGNAGTNLSTSFRGRREHEVGELTAGTSICRSMRSSSGPEMRAW